MIVIGVDPGLANCGWALYDSDKRQGFVGTWRTKKLATSHPTDLELRTNELCRRLRQLDAGHHVERVCIEAPLFFGPRARDLGVVWGALMSSVSHRPTLHVTPKEIRNHFLGNVKGRRAKAQYHDVLKENYIILGKESEHSLDALAVAIVGVELSF